MTGNRLAALFLLGVFAFSPPLLAIFAAQDGLVLGVPTLFLYLFGAWAALVALLAATLERAGDEE